MVACLVIVLNHVMNVVYSPGWEPNLTHLTFELESKQAYLYATEAVASSLKLTATAHTLDNSYLRLLKDLLLKETCCPCQSRNHFGPRHKRLLGRRSERYLVDAHSDCLWEERPNCLSVSMKLMAESMVCISLPGLGALPINCPKSLL